MDHTRRICVQMTAAIGHTRCIHAPYDPHTPRPGANRNRRSLSVAHNRNDLPIT